MSLASQQETLAFKYDLNLFGFFSNQMLFHFLFLIYLIIYYFSTF